LHTLVILEIIYFSIGIRAGTLCSKDLIPECDPYLFFTSIFYYTFYHGFLSVI
jgi:hypothetical protein